MNALERYQQRQERIAKVDRWLERNARWGWLLTALLAFFLFAVAMLVKAALDLIPGGGQ